MKWKLFADLAEVAGDRVVRVDVPEDATVDDALDALIEDCPPLRDRVLDDDETLQDHINLLCNGQTASLDQSVSEGDELALFPPVSGGCR
jgi:molybdopterin synthase sulfur carrier subunit